MSCNQLGRIVACIFLAGLLSGQGCPTAADSGQPADTAGTTTGDGQTATGGTSSTGNTGTTESTGNTSSTTSNPPTSIVEVEINEFVFTPKSVTIQAGQAVRWINRDFPTHSVWSGDPEDEDKGSLFSATLGIHGTFEYTFHTPGTYRYYDKYYYTMDGMRDATVIVTGTTGD